MKLGRKFTMGMWSVTVLVVSAFAGKFTPELGLYVSGIACAFMGADGYITGKALTSGKAGP